MANLFFVHTPLTLLIAQQIIKGEHLDHNLLLLGYPGSNNHYMDIYDLLKNESLWERVVIMPNVAGWASVNRRHLFDSMVTTWRKYKFIKNLILEYGIDTLFLSDMNNNSSKFAAKLFHHQGYRICFFEEGSSHYQMEYHYQKMGKMFNLILSYLIDAFYFLPLFHISYAKYSFWYDLPFSEIPMDIRYSVRPGYYQEKFDKTVIIKDILTDKLKGLVTKEMAGLDCGNLILFLTSPVYEGVSDVSLYIKAFDIYCDRLKGNQSIAIKFHPSETDFVKREMVDVVMRHNNRVKVIGKDMNLPVEIYLQLFRFREVVTYYTSSRFYNGYLFPLVKYTSLMNIYHDLCLKHGYERKENLERLEDFMRLDERIDAEEQSKMEFVGKYIVS